MPAQVRVLVSDAILSQGVDVEEGPTGTAETSDHPRFHVRVRRKKTQPQTVIVEEGPLGRSTVSER